MIQTSRNRILVPSSTVMPAVAHLSGDLRVARCTERLKVGVDVRAAAREREPMVNLGDPDVVFLDDGWTVVTADGKLSAQWEHTVLVTATGYELTTLL